MDIKINFINKSNDMHNSNVVIFQKNVAEKFDEIAVAWKVIKNCGRGWQHSFQYPLEYAISSSNIQMQLTAQHNHQYELLEENSRAILVSHADKGENNKGYTFVNNLPFEVVDADVYKDGTLIAKVPFVAPQQKAEIELSDNEICIAAVKFDTDEGNILPADFTKDSSCYTTLNIEGYKQPVIERTTDENGKSVFTLKEAETATAE